MRTQNNCSSNTITMKLPSIYTTLFLICIVSCCCNAEEESSSAEHPHSTLTDMLDHMLSYQQEHQHVAEETGIQVGQESDFLKGNTNNANNQHLPLLLLPDLLIASTADADDYEVPLPLGWEDVGRFLREPILSSHRAHDDFPAWQLWLGCLLALVGLSLVVTASTGCHATKKSIKDNDDDVDVDETLCLPTHVVQLLS
jgi:hypothetical protein